MKNIFRQSPTCISFAKCPKPVYPLSISALVALFWSHSSCEKKYFQAEGKFYPASVISYSSERHQTASLRNTHLHRVHTLETVPRPLIMADLGRNSWFDVKWSIRRVYQGSWEVGARTPQGQEWPAGESVTGCQQAPPCPTMSHRAQKCPIGPHCVLSCPDVPCLALESSR